MSKTLIIQSYQKVGVTHWLQSCMDSVSSWANLHKYEYKFIDDELFEYVAPEIIEKTKKQRVIATDLARLKVLQEHLNLGYETVVWCDADFLIFSPEEFLLPSDKYTVGREVWVQASNGKSKNISAHMKVHNAFMMYRSGNSFLDFYTDVAENLLIKNTGCMSPQFIGPKLLTAIHNVVQCPVLESAGMLSPLVLNDIVKGGGGALELFKRKSPRPIAAANLCNSLFESNAYSASTLEKCIDALKDDQVL